MTEELVRHLALAYVLFAGLAALVLAAAVCAIERLLALRSISSERGYRGLR